MKKTLLLIAFMLSAPSHSEITMNDGHDPEQKAVIPSVSLKTSGDPESDHRIIFIHGSPGNKEAYDDYLGHPALQDVDLVAVDRLGFGQSKTPVETSLKKQAQALLPLLQEKKKTLLVGHSLGGPIALQLALLAPDYVDSLLLIASAFDPKLEAPKWYNYMADTLLAKWVIPDDMIRSNEEMMVLDSELQKLAAQDWQALTMPIVLVHGEDDDLADPNNSLFAKERLPHANLKMLKDEGHFVLWQNVPVLVSQINEMIASAQ
ncbi:alpha/beta fold hydrolase [Enterovibrio calviensis]|uniref:alpha/beta fold hydrolase n=1 Tax=Enterovibrio calviensis TaxID=91359 RepID=UPI000685044E|nr:alpha/beta hydrolase [Enterovibrio calviensis]